MKVLSLPGHTKGHTTLVARSAHALVSHPLSRCNMQDATRFWLRRRFQVLKIATHLTKVRLA